MKRRGGGENAAHLCIAVLQAPDQVERSTSGDAAADDEQDAVLAVRFRRARLLSRRLRMAAQTLKDVVAGVCLPRPRAR